MHQYKTTNAFIATSDVIGRQNYNLWDFLNHNYAEKKTFLNFAIPITIFYSTKIIYNNRFLKDKERLLILVQDL